jgi:hypothetical protein
MIHIPTPWLNLLRKEQFQQCYAQHKQCSIVTIRALCHMSCATRSYFRRTNELFSTRPNSIDDVVGTIANGKLCVLVLVDISLQVFLNDSQHISDDVGLFLQIATDGATTVFSKQYHITSRPRTLSSVREVIRDLTDRGRSLKSLVNRCLLTIRLTVEWWWPTHGATCLSKIPASRMPMICHRTAFESCGGPILPPEQTNQELPV